MRGYGIAITMLASLLCLGTAQGAPVALFNSFGPGDIYANGGTVIGAASGGIMTWEINFSSLVHRRTSLPPLR